MIPRVEKNVPVPRRRKRSDQNWSEFLSLLSVGDSFLVDPANQSAIYKAAAARGVRVTMKKTERGLRVWREK